MVVLASFFRLAPEEVRHYSLKKAKHKKKIIIRDQILIKTITFLDLTILKESEGDPVQDHKWIPVSGAMAGSKHLSNLMSYTLTLTPYSMATIDGFFAKSQ